MNLVNTIKSRLGGETLDRLADSTGLDPGSARQAVDAAVPTIMAALGKTTSTSEGAARLSSTLDNLDPGLLNNLPGMLQGKSLSEMGSGLVKNLFGDSLMTGIQSALSRFTGIGPDTIGKILGPIAATLFGTLKQQKDQQGLDARGLSSLIEGQKSNIASAMPAGLGSMLGNIPGLGDLGNLARGASEGAVHAAARTGEATVDAGSAALKWILPVAGLLLVLGVVWWFFIRERPEVVTAPTSTTPTNRGPGTLPTSRSTSFTNPGETIAAESSTFFKSATESLTGIKDAATAETALPKLKELSGSLDTLKTGMSSLAGDARSSLVTTIKASVEPLNKLIDRVLLIPGVKEKIGPTIEEIKTKLTGLTA